MADRRSNMGRKAAIKASTSKGFKRNLRSMKALEPADEFEAAKRVPKCPIAKPIDDVSARMLARMAAKIRKQNAASRRYLAAMEEFKAIDRLVIGTSGGKGVNGNPMECPNRKRLLGR